MATNRSFANMLNERPAKDPKKPTSPWTKMLKGKR